jgi:hypothetical protein
MAITALGIAGADHVLVVRTPDDAAVMASGEFGALLAGARVTTGAIDDPSQDVERLGHLDISVVVAGEAALERLLLEATQRPPDAAVRAVACVGPQLPHAARARWRAATGRDVPWFTLARSARPRRLTRAAGTEAGR